MRAHAEKVGLSGALDGPLRVTLWHGRARNDRAENYLPRPGGLGRLFKGEVMLRIGYGAEA
jgi:hypothetical protein